MAARKSSTQRDREIAARVGRQIGEEIVTLLMTTTALTTTARLVGAPGGQHVEQQAEEAWSRLPRTHAR